MKVLDFGLAKVNGLMPASGDPEESPTTSMKATQAGMILRTASQDLRRFLGTVPAQNNSRQEFTMA